MRPSLSVAREEHITFPITHCFPVTLKYKIASFKVAKAAHDPESFFQISSVNVSRCPPTPVAGCPFPDQEIEKPRLLDKKELI